MIKKQDFLETQKIKNIEKEENSKVNNYSK